mgnify:FL=1
MFSRELFGQRLLEIRKKNHETQPDLAQLLNVSKSRISEMENGKNTTTIEKFALICEHYKVSANYLLGLSDDPKI